MLDKKLTDSEIVKVLDEAELFLRNRVMDGQSLKLNEYDIGILRNISQVCAKAYDEIKRLQAENDNSRKEMEGWRNTAYHEASQCETAKAEAYKEFAERLKERTSNKFWDGNKMHELKVPFVGVDDIDNLLKEMEGE